MAITENAIQLLASERLTDYDDGGGMMTGNVVVDGASNNLFDDISELDRTYGRVSLRKCYAAVRTALADSYYGAHLIVAEAPKDPLVSMTMFNSKSWVDERSDARDFIERYLARGGKWQGYLWERQLAGQRVIQIWQRVNVELPSVGAVFCLVNDIDKPTEVEQYVRTTRVSAVLREFFFEQGGKTTAFKVNIVTCELSDPLRHDFTGPAVSPYDSAVDAAPGRILQTVVADAAKYYGVSKLAQPAKLGDMRVRVSSIFSQLVPSARAETPIVDANAAGEITTLVPSGGEVSYSYSAGLSPTASLYLGTPLMPGTLSIIVGGLTLKDLAGELKDGAIGVGSVDYARGLVQIVPGGLSYSGTKQVKYKPAGAPMRMRDSIAIKIGIENRGFSYPITLPVSPTPGSLVVSFMAQGKWYDLRDDGSGALKGVESAFGAGSVNYPTGSVIVTCGALTDVGSSIVFSWATAVNYFDRSSQTIRPPALKVQLFTEEEMKLVSINFSSIRILWTDGTTEKLATVSVNGTISGDASGNVYQDGSAYIVPAKSPLGGVEFRVSWTVFKAESISVATPNAMLNKVATLELGHSFQQGSLTLTTRHRIPLILPPSTPGYWKEKRSTYLYETVSIHVSDVNGRLINQNGVDVGSADYVTGTLKIATEMMMPTYKQEWQFLTHPAQGNTGGYYSDWVVTKVYQEDVLTAFDGSFSPYALSYARFDNLTPVEKVYPLAQLSIDLTDGFSERIVAGSVAFDYAGQRYVDVGGRLTTAMDPNTGAGVTAGTINYQSGEVTITNWTPNASNAVKLNSVLTEIGSQPAGRVTFRVPVAPLRPGSLSLSATSVDGSTSRVDSDMDSIFSNDKMTGEIDYLTGVVTVNFGKWVLASTLPDGSYEPDAVKDGKIWAPSPVMADTIRYNAVGYTYLPMDSEVLGLDAVRLPADGRIPIFSSDNVVVVHHTGRYVLPSVVTGGIPYSVGRGRLAAVEIVDAQGKKMDKAKYTADLDAGTVSLKTPLDLAGLVMPLTVEHRIEDMARCYDVQISGEIALTRQLSHDYPATETLVSSAMLLGDIKARYAKLFSQQSWTNKWLDVIDGSAILAKYNDTQYPLACVNEGTVDQKWALIFTSTSDFRIVGETLGQIGTGTINADCKPINPVTGTPYFSMRDVGWGGGWSAGNVLRFNTHPANAPAWLARTVLMGPATAQDDRFVIQIRGDADN